MVFFEVSILLFAMLALNSLEISIRSRRLWNPSARLGEDVLVIVEVKGKVANGASSALAIGRACASVNKYDA